VNDVTLPVVVWCTWITSSPRTNPAPSGATPGRSLFTEVYARWTTATPSNGVRIINDMGKLPLPETVKRSISEIDKF
jgi:hypothetical protein